MGHGPWGFGCPFPGGSRSEDEGVEERSAESTPRPKEKRRERTPEEEAHRRARRRAAAEAGFYAHFVSYLGVIALLAFINLMTRGGPWFLWPAGVLAVVCLLRQTRRGAG